LTNQPRTTRLYKDPVSTNYYPDEPQRPQSGDFFQIGKKGGRYEHVGVILDSVGNNWTTVEAGQGGPKSGYDSIKRKGPRPFDPAKFMGWIDIEAYFEGWKDPSG
jgi:hypothetical protein